MANIDRLIAKMQYHEDKANEYYEVIKTIEDKKRLIGFKPQNDERGSTDMVSIKAPTHNSNTWGY